MSGVLQTLTNDMRDYVATVEERLAKVKAADLPSACRAYYSLKNNYEAFELQRKKLGELIETFSRVTLVEMLEEADVSNITVEIEEHEVVRKYRFGKNQRFSCSMPDKEGGMAWLRENGQDGIIQETVNSGTLASFAKSYIQDTGKDLPDNLFKLSTLTYVSMTKA